MTSVRVDRTLDCIGLICPLPVLKASKEIDQLAPGQILEVLADDPAADADFRAWAKRTGHELLAVEERSEGKRFLIQKK